MFVNDFCIYDLHNVQQCVRGFIALGRTVIQKFPNNSIVRTERGVRRNIWCLRLKCRRGNSFVGK
jgi:hypothetical protein